jgi:hypothetical protein
LPIQPSTRLVCWRRVQSPAPDLADLKGEKPDWKQRKKGATDLLAAFLVVLQVTTLSPPARKVKRGGSRFGSPL